MKTKTVYIIIGSILVVGAAVGAYFIFKKPKDDVADPKGDASSPPSPPSPKPVATPPSCEFPSTPFVDNVQGNHFRTYINQRHPTLAKRIDLDPIANFKGAYDNCHIREAWKLRCKNYLQDTTPETDPNYSVLNYKSKFKRACN